LYVNSKFATKLLLFFRLHKILSCFFSFSHNHSSKKTFFSKKFPKFALKLFTTSNKKQKTQIFIINTKKKHTKKEFFDL